MPENSSVFFPYHDPDGRWRSVLEKIRPELKGLFSKAYLSVTPLTQQNQKEFIRELQSDNFFRINFNDPTTQVGDHLKAGYQNVINNSSPSEWIHLCFMDRLAFALFSEQRDSFIRDLSAAPTHQVPVLFQRSARAWRTHPDNYLRLEQFVTQTGEFLYHKRLDFCWCHLALTAGQLAKILPNLHSHDMSILAEIIIQLKDLVQCKEVDWLAWEDPYIFNIDPILLKREREEDPQEIRKRLSYVIPSLQILLESIQ